MVDTDKLSHQQQLQQQRIMSRRLQLMRMRAAQQHQNTRGNSNGDSDISSQPQRQTAGSIYDDLPSVNPSDLDLPLFRTYPEYFGQDNAFKSFKSFESACQNGPLSTVQFIVSSETRTPAFLHHGLTLALTTGNVEITSYLLSAGAPIVRQTPNNILSAPSDQQIPLFELLTHHGWTPNTPGYYGNVLLTSVVTDLPLLGWFLSHGANPNLGRQRDYRDRTGGSETGSCAALELAASRGNVEAVRMLLDAGAEVRNGLPLHYAAGVCPPGMNPFNDVVKPSKEFDENRIPVMALLVERGADVNQMEESRHMVARYAVVHAVMAGAVERVRWLLERGANPEARGAWGSAVSIVKRWASEEMRRVVEEGLMARRWINGNVRDAELTQ